MRACCASGWPGGQREAVGELAVVQDGAAARLAADDRTIAAGRVLLAVGVALEVAERQRRLAPLVEPQRGDAVFDGVQSSDFVDRHVPGAGSGGSMIRRTVSEVGHCHIASSTYGDAEFVMQSLSVVIGHIEMADCK